MPQTSLVMESVVGISSCSKIVMMRAVLLALQTRGGHEARGEETVCDDVVQMLIFYQNIRFSTRDKSQYLTLFATRLRWMES